MKRKSASGDSRHPKRVKLDATSHKKINPRQNIGQGPINQTGLESAQRDAKAPATTTSSTISSKPAPQPSNRRENIRKLAPPRPFPTVPTSVSASGPKSAHKEGKNLICVTRHTPLAAYLSRCKKLLVEEGYNMIQLHGMGAAIPHLLTLSVTLPRILPFAKDDIQIEVRTGTIEVLDEVIPDDEDEDISLRTRGKGGVSVILKIRGAGDRAGADNSTSVAGSGGKGKQRQVIVVQEQEQDEEMEDAQ
ncbi:hypothetical protein JB92DRAFT_2913000 [Gautieria morchelliformis]|nr:hypothetical protein JB92DRAFT_2913000 [Gautieria morchelliformis]